MMTLGEKLKKLRNEKGVTQTTASIQMGITKAMLASYELDNRIPKLEILNTLAEYYRVDPGDLINPNSVPTYKPVELKDIFAHHDITIEGKRLLERDKALIYRVIKAIANPK